MLRDLRKLFKFCLGSSFQEFRILLIPIWSRVVACGRTEGQTDMKKLIVAILNFANAPKN